MSSAIQLVVPHTGALDPTDARLVRLAELLGIGCERLCLDRQVERHTEHMTNLCPGERFCLLLNARVIKEWTGGVLPADLPLQLMSRFQYLLVHSLEAGDSFDEALIDSLSGGRLRFVRRVQDVAVPYNLPAKFKEVSDAFAGLSFGPVDPVNDVIFPVNGNSADIQTPISIGGDAFMALVKREKSDVVFLGCRDTADVDEEIGDRPLTEYFSRFMPQAMALRYIFGEQCWRPSGHYASFIIDDPLLRPKYGHLDYATLLRMMEEYQFSSTVAFIPHNYRRNAKRTVQMFRESGGRLAICFHGNDHTAGEFASTDSVRLNTLIRTAEARMDLHTKATGLPCPKVMVFPQDDFSVEAATVLKSRNFLAAVCGNVHPGGRRVNLTLAERMQPAILRHGDFPIFLRRFVGQVRREDLAFNLFFGQPVLITEHHGLFEHVKTLVDDVLLINSIAPAIQWSDLGTALMNSTLQRRTPDGILHVRAFSGAVRIRNESDRAGRFLAEWNHSSAGLCVEQVFERGTPVHSFAVDDSSIRVSVDLPAYSSEILSVGYRNDYSSLPRLGFLWDAKAFARRRLSEARDNYVSKNDFTMAVGQCLKHRVLSKIL